MLRNISFAYHELNVVNFMNDFNKMYVNLLPHVMLRFRINSKTLNNRKFILGLLTPCFFSSSSLPH